MGDGAVVEWGYELLRTKLNILLNPITRVTIFEKFDPGHFELWPSNHKR